MCRLHSEIRPAFFYILLFPVIDLKLHVPFHHEDGVMDGSYVNNKEIGSALL